MLERRKEQQKHPKDPVLSSATGPESHDLQVRLMALLLKNFQLSSLQNQRHHPGKVYHILKKRKHFTKLFSEFFGFHEENFKSKKIPWSLAVTLPKRSGAKRAELFVEGVFNRFAIKSVNEIGSETNANNIISTSKDFDLKIERLIYLFEHQMFVEKLKAEPLLEHVSALFLFPYTYAIAR